MYILLCVGSGAGNRLFAPPPSMHCTFLYSVPFSTLLSALRNPIGRTVSLSTFVFKIALGFSQQGAPTRDGREGEEKAGIVNTLS